MMNAIAAPILNSLAALAASLRRRGRRPVAAPPVEAVRSLRVPPERISIDAQWARVAGVVTSATATVDAVRDMQAAAGQQIDSAAYALQGLIAELSSVMTLPSLPQAETNIHRLEPQLAPALRRELAA